LYDSTRGTVILTRQFRLPIYVNGNASGMLPFAAELAKVSGGEIRDAKTIMLLYYVQIHGLMAGTSAA